MSLLCLIFFLTFCSSTDDMKKYEWFPSECAPHLYPVEIIEGAFLNKSNGSTYIPNRKVVNNGWASIGSTHIVGEDSKELPVSFNLLWFSLAERKFYQIDTTLEEELIASSFETGFISPKTGQESTYDRIIAGMAPGGKVAIWLSGEGIFKEIGYYIAEEINIKWSSIYESENLPQDLYIQLNYQDIFYEEEIKWLEEHEVPLGMWDHYRKPFDWKLNILGKVEPVNLWIDYYNGEVDYINFKNDKINDILKNVAPKKIEIKWQGTNGNEYVGKIKMDQDEIYNAFTRFSNRDGLQPIEMNIEINYAANTVRTLIRNNKEFIELMACETKIFKK